MKLVESPWITVPSLVDSEAERFTSPSMVREAVSYWLWQKEKSASDAEIESLRDHQLPHLLIGFAPARDREGTEVLASLLHFGSEAERQGILEQLSQEGMQVAVLRFKRDAKTGQWRIEEEDLL